MSLCKLTSVVAIVSLIAVYIAIVMAGGSCQSYGHSCLGGHGKRNGEAKEAAYGLHLLLQQALRDRMPFYDYRSPDREAYDFLSGFSDNRKDLDSNLQK
ncbi:uncharacterized protein LOC129231848 [Uloborus diversus]|uniref:uncharacterized protein LOC129231848 n=1 Tax=Uloborus diversus TaxID=327109 RepID=UPI0024095C56|nr:uncharacterized protein LOC129231848 [Uloborus diversus]